LILKPAWAEKNFELGLDKHLGQEGGRQGEQLFSSKVRQHPQSATLLNVKEQGQWASHSTQQEASWSDDWWSSEAAFGVIVTVSNPA
jgi:hypothetical protein